jgi:hypothetical protein
MLVAVWSGVGAFAQDEGEAREHAPLIEVVNEVEEAAREGRVGSDGAALLTSLGVVAPPSQFDVRGSVPLSVTEFRRPLRHLLCVYRL